MASCIIAESSKRGAKKAAQKAPNPTLSQLGVRGLNPAQKALWNERFKYTIFGVTKYPDDGPLLAAGISEPFWALAEIAGLTKIFKGLWPTYIRMNMEFLSTFEIDKTVNPVIVKGIKFRLNNSSYELTHAQLQEAYGNVSQCIEQNYARTDFWREITLSEGVHDAHKYVGQGGRASKIRNPVLRWLNKAIANGPFARDNNDRVQTHELYILWKALRGAQIDVVHHLMLHLERSANQTGGIFLAGGMITAIADYLKIEYKSWDKVEAHETDNDLWLSWSSLYSMRVLRIDSRGSGFMVQKNGDHFPLPCPAFTFVSTAEWGNLLMNTEEHLRITNTYKPLTPWKAKRKLIFFTPYEHERPEGMMELPWNHPIPEPEQMNEEPIPEQPVEQPEEVLRPRRRRRREPAPAEQPEQPHGMVDDWQTRMGNLETSLNELRAEMQQGFAAMGSRFDTLDHGIAGMSANFTYMMEMMLMQQCNAFPPQQPPSFYPFYCPQPPPQFPPLGDKE